MHVFYDFFYSEINSLYYFHLKMNIFSFAQVFLLFITSSISLSCKAKINLALLFRLKNPESQYTCHKKYGVHLWLSEPFDLVCLQQVCSTRLRFAKRTRASSTYDSYCKLYTQSKKAHFARCALGTQYILLIIYITATVI